jgi:hypothetical protein
LVPSTDETAFGLWATPTIKGNYNRKGLSKTSGDGLATQVRMWPTPMVPNGGRTLHHVTEWRGNTAYHNGRKVQVNLRHAVRMWPTPNAGDYKAGMSNSPNRQQSSLPRSVGIAEGKSSGRRGGLNPTWVEWLMGFPMEWTALKVSATPSSRKSRKSSDAQS